jgi:hypothetical protein
MRAEMTAPGTALREVVATLDPDQPGARFRIDAANKAADIIDAWWAEMEIIQKQPDEEYARGLHGVACITIARVLSSVLTGTLAFFDDEEAVCNTVSAIAVIIADAEDYLDAELDPPRELIEAARGINGFDVPAGKPH